jgi:hypothetical protein
MLTVERFWRNLNGLESWFFTIQEQPTHSSHNRRQQVRYRDSLEPRRHLKRSASIAAVYLEEPRL